METPSSFARASISARLGPPPAKTSRAQASSPPRAPREHAPRETPPRERAERERERTSVMLTPPEVVHCQEVSWTTGTAFPPLHAVAHRDRVDVRAREARGQLRERHVGIDVQRGKPLRTLVEKARSA